MSQRRAPSATSRASSVNPRGATTIASRSRSASIASKHWSAEPTKEYDGDSTHRSHRRHGAGEHGSSACGSVMGPAMVHRAPSRGREGSWTVAASVAAAAVAAQAPVVAPPLPCLLYSELDFLEVATFAGATLRRVATDPLAPQTAAQAAAVSALPANTDVLLSFHRTAIHITKAPTEGPNDGGTGAAASALRIPFSEISLIRPVDGEVDMVWPAAGVTVTLIIVRPALHDMVVRWLTYRVKHIAVPARPDSSRALEVAAVLPDQRLLAGDDEEYSIGLRRYRTAPHIDFSTKRTSASAAPSAGPETSSARNVKAHNEDASPQPRGGGGKGLPADGAGSGSCSPRGLSSTATEMGTGEIIPRMLPHERGAASPVTVVGGRVSTIPHSRTPTANTAVNAAYARQPSTPSSAGASPSGPSGAAAPSLSPVPHNSSGTVAVDVVESRDSRREQLYAQLRSLRQGTRR